MSHKARQIIEKTLKKPVYRFETENDSRGEKLFAISENDLETLIAINMRYESANAEKCPEHHQ